MEIIKCDPELKKLFTNNDKEMATYWDMYFKNRKDIGYFTDEEINNLPPPPFQLLFDDSDKNGSFFGGVLSQDLEYKIFRMAGFYRVPDNTPQTEWLNLLHNNDSVYFDEFKERVSNIPNMKNTIRRKRYERDTIVHRNKNSKHKKNQVIQKVCEGTMRKGDICEDYNYPVQHYCRTMYLLDNIQRDLYKSGGFGRLQHNRLVDYHKYSYIYDTKHGREYSYDEDGFIKHYNTSELCVLDNYTKESLIKYIKERVMIQYRDDIKKSWSKNKIIKWYIKHDP